MGLAAKKPAVFDPIRRKLVAAQPEEMVRQLLLVYLLQELKYPPGRIRVEMGIDVNGLKKRCDILVFDANFQPWLLVECKSPKIKITQEVSEQAARYNMPLQVPFLVLSNGMQTYCCAMDYVEKTIKFIPHLPHFT